MTGAPNSASRQTGGVLAFVVRGCAAVDRTVEGALALLAAAMVGVGAVQVFSRYVLNHSLSWSEEFQRFAHIWLVMLAVPVAYNRGAHLGMTVLRDRLPRGMQRAIRAMCDVLWLCLGAILALSTFPVMRNARTQVSPGLGLRMDWVYACLALGGTYMAFVALRRLLRGAGAPPRPGNATGEGGARC